MGPKGNSRALYFSSLSGFPGWGTVGLSLVANAVQLGTIWLDGYDINASMVDSGLAWVYRFQDEAIVPAYIKFETGAKNASLGLWSEKSPVPPWEWRQINKKSEKQEKKTPRASW